MHQVCPEDVHWSVQSQGGGHPGTGSQKSVLSVPVLETEGAYYWASASSQTLVLSVPISDTGGTLVGDLH
jgi:hypothetical protein